ncbi:MAG: hypothetical protein NTX97_13550 [Bacteroidetes bacterium]|nr:hypothetical protein [Bacteroidota bacterium]
MKSKIFHSFIGLILFSNCLFSQKSPYKIDHSVEFESAKGLPLSQTNPYNNGDVLLTYAKGEKLNKIGFQLFSSDLTLNTSSNPNVKSLFPSKKSYFDRVVVMNKKSYVFVREVFKDTKTEGISAVEFSPGSLELTSDPIKLFQSSRGIIYGGYGYSASTSNDKTKLFYSYNLFNREKRDVLNKQEFGFYMFDENMKQIWGGEYEMPYTEAKMSPIDYQVSNDGKLYYLISVTDAEGRDGGSHFEILVYSKDKKDPKIIELKIDDYTPKSTYLYEDKSNNIVVAGFYSKKGNPSIDGAFMVKLDAASGKFAKLGGGYYEIPSDLIKSFMTDRQKEKLEKKEKKNEGNEKRDLGINDLKIQKIHFLENGSTVIVSEIYFTVVSTYYDGKTTHTTYNTYARDLVIFSIDPAGNLAWIKKIPKSQHEASAAGVGISISSAVKGNHIHIFYLDHIDNFSLKENEAPKVHQSRMGGFIAAVDINEKGEITKYNLGEANQFETNLYMRNFVDGKKNNLVAVERKKKKNMLFSIEIK